eukprot:365946-Chlamydomonas_euryale.AAC.7
MLTTSGPRSRLRRCCPVNVNHQRPQQPAATPLLAASAWDSDGPAAWRQVQLVCRAVAMTRCPHASDLVRADQDERPMRTRELVSLALMTIFERNGAPQKATWRALGFESGWSASVLVEGLGRRASTKPRPALGLRFVNEASAPRAVREHSHGCQQLAERRNWAVAARRRAVTRHASLRPCQSLGHNHGPVRAADTPVGSTDVERRQGEQHFLRDQPCCVRFGDGFLGCGRRD